MEKWEHMEGSCLKEIIAMKNKKTPLKDCPLEQKKLPRAYYHLHG